MTPSPSAQGRKAKLAVSVDHEVVGQVKALVAAGHAPSVSAYVEHALRAQVAAEAAFDTMLVEMLAETGGPPTDAERTAARQLLGA